MSRFCILGRWLVGVMTFVLVLATGIGFLGGLTWFFDLFAHFRVQLSCGLLVCLVASWRLRQPRIAALAAVFALVNIVVVSPQLVYEPTAEARGEGAIRLLHANVNYYNRDFDSALDFFRETDPDVLLLVEANEHWMSELSSLKDELPYTELVQKGKMGIGLMSRYPVSTKGRYFSPGNPSIVAQVETPEGPLLLIGTHPLSPANSRRARRRDQQLSSIASYVARVHEPTVLLGDFNTTPWGHSFRSLVRDSGLRDSSRGVGFQWSWPSRFWPLAIPIDHALVSDGVRVLDRRMGRSIGSDHLPLVLDITLNNAPVPNSFSSRMLSFQIPSPQ